MSSYWWVYSATQSIWVDCGEVGHPHPDEHHVCCVRSNVIAWSGISEAFVTDPHGLPSTV